MRGSLLQMENFREILDLLKESRDLGEAKIKLATSDLVVNDCDLHKIREILYSSFPHEKPDTLNVQQLNDVAGGMKTLRKLFNSFFGPSQTENRGLQQNPDAVQAESGALHPNQNANVVLDGNSPLDADAVHGRDFQQDPNSAVVPGRNSHQYPYAVPGRDLQQDPDAVPGRDLQQDPYAVPGRDLQQDPDAVPGRDLQQDPDAVPGRDLQQDPDAVPGRDLQQDPNAVPGRDLQQDPYGVPPEDRTSHQYPDAVPPEDRELHRPSFIEFMASGPAVDPYYFQSEIDRLKNALPENENNPNRFVYLDDFLLKNNRDNIGFQVSSDSEISIAPEALMKHPLPPNLYVVNTNEINSELPFVSTEMIVSLFGRNSGIVSPTGPFLLNKDNGKIQELGAFATTLFDIIRFNPTGKENFDILAGELPREDGKIQKYLSDKKEVKVYPCTQVKNLYVNKSYPRELNGVSVAFVAATDRNKNSAKPNLDYFSAACLLEALVDATNYFVKNGKSTVFVPQIGGNFGLPFICFAVVLTQLACLYPNIRFVAMTYSRESNAYFGRKACRCLTTEVGLRDYESKNSIHKTKSRFLDQGF